MDEKHNIVEESRTPALDTKLEFFDNGAGAKHDAHPLKSSQPSGGEPNQPSGCPHKATGRNLVVCIDSTANKFGKSDTNVIKLYKLINKSTDGNQHTWYNSGIGTCAKPHWRSPRYLIKIIDRTIDQAIAWNFDKTVKDAYRWLSDNYEDGDRIFLFGFSRGAHQVRTLSAMIDTVGLLYKGNIKQIPFAYELYAGSKKAGSKESKAPNSEAKSPGIVATLSKKLKVGKSNESNESKAARFKETFSRTIQVHFVGAWDTVSSIGVVRNKESLPRTADGMGHVCYFRQALALDERRVKFQPEYANGDQPTEPPASSAPYSEHRPQILEVWFAGTHSDIGGGNVYPGNIDSSIPPLRWVAEEARAAGLGINDAEAFKTVPPNPKEQVRFPVTESLKGAWKVVEYIPVRRSAFSQGSKTTRKLHLGSGRQIQEGQKIHSSLVFGDRAYIPKASLPPTLEWNGLRHGVYKNPHNLLEFDLHEDPGRVVTRIMNVPVEAQNLRKILEKIAKNPVGAQNLYDEVIKTIRSQEWSAKNNWNVLGQCRLLEMSTEVLTHKAHWLKMGGSLFKVQDSLAHLLKKQAETWMSTVATEFIRQLTAPWISEFTGHKDDVLSVAISPDETLIVSGSRDKSVRIWNAVTGNMLKVLKGHTDDVNSVAISSDRKVIVSGSDDRSVRIWDMERGRGDMLKVLKGHTHKVNGVAISFDGKHIVSGSDDRSVRVWDAETGSVLRVLKGDTNEVNCVAIPSERKLIVSGSNDGSVSIWDSEEGSRLKVLKGHTDKVNSVAISPDGRRIISGSDDRSVRVWGAETGNVLRVLEGHTDDVNSVAISPDGKRIISGSGDGSVRIWDSDTGKTLRTLIGHLDSVESVAFSSNGTGIVSGSSDESIRIWNAEMEPIPLPSYDSGSRQLLSTLV